MRAFRCRVSWAAVALLPVLLLMVADPAGQSNSVEAVQQAFLEDEAGMAEALALLAHPELIRERPVQAKLLRALRAPDMDAFKAAAAVAMQLPEIDFKAPRVWRRLETTFLAQAPERKVALLELAKSRIEVRQDLRIVGLVAAALLEKDTDLAQVALSLTQLDPGLAANPAVAEALSTVHQIKIASRVPDFSRFRSEIVPVLTTPGSDATACVECHKNRTIMHLLPVETIEDETERARQYYRSVLRVINLDDPEASLLLVKPTKPAPQTLPSPASLKTHTGGARFQVGDETYRKLVEWIQSGS